MVRIYVDTETTGLNPETCSIFQLSGIIVHDGETEEFDFRMKPFRGDVVPPEVTAITGVTQEEVETYPDQEVVFQQWIDLLNKYIDIKDYAGRAYFIGYNSDFDRRFIRAWHEFNNNKQMGWYFFFPDIDVMRIAAFYLIGRVGTLPNFKLGTVYKYFFGKDFEGAHDSMNDIRATKEILDYLAGEMLFKNMKESPEIKVRTKKIT